jgi:hypothetical protein
VDDRALDELRALAREDRALEHRAHELRGFDAEVRAIRERAEAIAAFFAGFGDAEGRRADEVREADDELSQRRGELADAESDAAAARDEVAREHAAKAVARARDHVEVALVRVARAGAARDELELQAASLPAELVALDERARAVVEVAAPAGDLVEWASRAHAELFVALGQVDVLRERVIREANELATMLTAEMTYGSTVAQALERAERYWTSAPGQVSDSR